MDKKIRPLFLAVCLTAALLLPASGSVSAAARSGVDGGVYWEISENVLTISTAAGTDGKMPSYSYTAHAPWQESPGMKSVEKVVIRDGVKALGSLAFYSEDIHLKEMQIPGSIETVPAYFCKDITVDALYLNEGVRFVEKEAFIGRVSTLYLAKSVENLPLSAFGTNNSLATGTVAYVSRVYGYAGSAAQRYAQNYMEAVAATNGLSHMWSDGRKYELDADLDGQADADPKITFTALDDPAVFQSAKVTSSLSVSVKKTAAIKVTVPSGLTAVGKYNGTEGEVKISYKSKNGKIASVNANGVVTGKKKGSTTITTTLKLQNGTKKKFTTKVTVK